MKKPNDPLSLEPLIDLCFHVKGAKSEVVQRLTLNKTPATWAQVSGWLHPIKHKRVEPSHERRLQLIKIYNQMQEAK